MSETFDYAEAKADADELIREFGQSGWLRSLATGGATPYDPVGAGQSDTDAVFAVLDFDAREIDGSRILATDKKVVLSAEGLAESPTTAHKLVEASGSVYSIVDVGPLSPGGTVVVWQLQVRR